MKNKTYLFFLSLGLLILFSSAQPITKQDLKNQEDWVDNVFQSLSETERIAQLFMVATGSITPNATKKIAGVYGKDELAQHEQEIEHLITRYNIGGLIFFQGGPMRQAQLTNRYQKLAKTKLLMAIDAEWGLGMRLDSTISYPKQMTLGAIKDTAPIYEMGTEIARQLQLVGVHINFAPVIDINNNPNNPVIGRRAFGDNKRNVAAKGIAYMKGLQDHGILAVGKHFPGHGDTNVDSHLDLPVIDHTRERLDTVELYPFKKAIAASMGGIMVAHLHMPAYDSLPTTLSKNVITNLLKKQLGFQGLVFTDALNMKALRNYYQPGEIDLRALMAGNDILVFPQDVPKAIQLIQIAIAMGDLDQSTIDEKVKKILRLKFKKGLHRWKPLPTKRLYTQLNTPRAQLLKQQLFEKAITVVANKGHLIPLKKLDTLTIASLAIVNESNENLSPGLQQDNLDPAATDKQIDKNSTTNAKNFILEKYAPVTRYTLARKTMTAENLDALAEQLKAYNLVIVDIHDMRGGRTQQFGLTQAELLFLKTLQAKTPLIVMVFGNVYSLAFLQDFDHVIAAYENDPIAVKVVPQIIFGALPAQGVLPITVSQAWPAGWGIPTKSLQRLGYTCPEGAGMDSHALQYIDAIVNQAIANQAMPGGQVVVARKGKVVFEKAYGYYTYDKQQPVTTETLYDVASVTKVAGTLQALMYLAGERKLNVKKRLSAYLPELKKSFKTNKSRLRINDVLVHQAGLISHLNPILQDKLLDDELALKEELFTTMPSEDFRKQIAPGLYAPPALKDSVWYWLLKTGVKKRKLFKKPAYRYSCIGAYLLQRLIEKQLAQPIDVFLDKNFYRPLGLTTATYHPLDKFSQNSIAPTEAHNDYSNTIIHGVVGMVHDPMAALYGGVGGNAGLFSNAHDLAVILQMNLQDGTYGGTRYLAPGIVGKFTAKQSKNNRRGLGWDKPETDTRKGSPASAYASAATYGHLGFTGTGVWVDPTYDLVYVFLSNRTFPSSRKGTFVSSSVRTKVQDAIYKALR